MICLKADKQMSFNRVLEKYRQISFSERDKGDRFERLMQAYLLTDPRYANLFKKVWLWSEFPYKSDLGEDDTGIDLVALTVEGDYWAIQCKCYLEDSIISKPTVDSFLATSSREFKSESGQILGFKQRLWISTTNKWGANATEAIRNQNPPVARLNLFDLSEAPVDWGKLDVGIHGEASRTPQKSLLAHQKVAMEEAHDYFKNSNRGKLIMACGTGKTFTSLRIAEMETNGRGLILFLVPSISLLSQALREWSSDAKNPINAICICSDPEVSRKRIKNEDTDAFSVIDLALPASTSTEDVLSQFRQIKEKGSSGMTVVFSTYQSIEVISKAQKVLLENGFPEFDLIICDEAHRTTGVTLAGEDESAFTKVHYNEFLKAKNRLYMTATPRLYSDDMKSRAAQSEAILCSMDDATLYGEEIYRIGFGEAVKHDLLTDYKVIILTLNDKDVPPIVQRMISDRDTEINTDDASKLIGCINALSKQFLGDGGETKQADPEPMRRAVAFCANIGTSQKITETYNSVTDAYIQSLPPEKREQMVSVTAMHIDGTMTAPDRDQKLGWLKAPLGINECHILTNVRCLSEGVDVPSLDAVLFLSARNSQVDVVQSVGRVMRKAPNKKYGYIIIPVVVPVNVDAARALDDNDRYRVVWTVLNALRAHDDRFNATVNKIELNRNKPNNILVGRPDYTFNDDGFPVQVQEDHSSYQASANISNQLALQFEQLQNIVFARMVEKVGQIGYWEQWAKSVAEIAERQVERINRLIEDEGKHKEAFEKFLSGLQKNINPSVTEQEAVEMLSQHIITKPVFEALFENYSFVKHNAISISMQSMMDLLEKQAVEKDTEALNKFYEWVKTRASGIDNSEAKQGIIIKLYDNFFKAAFPKVVEKLGIVYTPVEVVDFIIHSVNDVLKKEFDRSIGDDNIHILDPFTGTGTFITRILQSGLIDKRNLKRKYEREMYANEIVLLAYYIAAVNIENAFHDIMEATEFTPFDGICLTDTFQLGESDDGDKLFSEMFPQNSKRVQLQKKAPLRIIIGNPPYSVGQRSANDNAQNIDYPNLDARITETYVAGSSAGLNKSLYDSYIKAFRWSSDRLDKNGGIICFVSNGAWIDSNSSQGFRKSLEREFTTIYVFNLRGNQRTSGELSRKEGGKIFGSGSRTPIAITLLVRNTLKNEGKATIYYHDIGDYLNREEKLSIIKKFGSVSNVNINWKQLRPNEYADWTEIRNKSFESFIPIDTDKKGSERSASYFSINGPGISSQRDAWVFNFSKANIKKSVTQSIDFYNDQLESFAKVKRTDQGASLENLIDSNPKKISWTVNLKSNLEKGVKLLYRDDKFVSTNYRPFIEQVLYYDKSMIERPGLNRLFFPDEKVKNLVIAVCGIGSSKGFSALISDKPVCYDFLEKTQSFPLNYYEESLGLFEGIEKYNKKDGITDFILAKAKKQYGNNITKEDIFYYVYGFLHSPSYKDIFRNDLKKMLPRIPLIYGIKDFWAFSKAGRDLAELHINYSSIPPYPRVSIFGEDSKFYTVEKMRFPRRDLKDRILYNSKITISNIPIKAYEYVVNGKSAIEWIMERYQVSVHKESNLKNDPNDWADEVANPRYILDLLLSVINVSVQTVDIVESLPTVEFN